MSESFQDIYGMSAEEFTRRYGACLGEQLVASFNAYQETKEHICEKCHSLAMHGQPLCWWCWQAERAARGEPMSYTDQLRLEGKL